MRCTVDFERRRLFCGPCGPARERIPGPPPDAPGSAHTSPLPPHGHTRASMGAVHNLGLALRRQREPLESERVRS
jgi:hypothetical protein